MGRLELDLFAGLVAPNRRPTVGPTTRGPRPPTRDRPRWVPGTGCAEARRPRRPCAIASWPEERGWDEAGWPPRLAWWHRLLPHKSTRGQRRGKGEASHGPYWHRRPRSAARKPPGTAGAIDPPTAMTRILRRQPPFALLPLGPKIVAVERVPGTAVKAARGARAPGLAPARQPPPRRPASRRPARTGRDGGRDSSPRGPAARE